MRTPTPEDAAVRAVIDGVMMECGHAANAVQVLDDKRYPCCAICAGITRGDLKPYTVATNPPDLEGRRARCSYFGTSHDGVVCKGEEPSTPRLAFFEHCADGEFDRFYCGCWGWD